MMDKIKRGVLIGSIFAILGLAYSLFISSIYNQNFISLRTWKGGNTQSGEWTNRSNLVWFVQVSDIHISIYSSPSRIADFAHFCSNYINHIIRPTATFVTGDIVDSKHHFLKASRLIEKEWEIYFEILENSNVFNNTLWFHLRGNHDNSMVADKAQYKHIYEKSHKTNKLGDNYEAIVETDFGSYRFLCLDLAPSPGLLLPFNFFAKVSSETKKWALKRSRDHMNYNHTVWLSHYPLSAISPYSDSVILRQYARNGIAFCFGHFHKLLSKFYGRDPRHGNLLLELGDWRAHRSFRIFAFDNDIFSFQDFTYSNLTCSYVLITNPKNFDQVTPHLEPILRISHSNHIRALIFSKEVIEHIIVEINGNRHCSFHSNHTSNDGEFDGQVFTCPWNPSDLLTKGKLHRITITTKTVSGCSTDESHEFSLDGSYGMFRLFPTIFIFGNFELMVKTIYIMILIATVIIPQVVTVWPNFIFSRIFKRKLKAMLPFLEEYFNDYFNVFPMSLYSFIILSSPSGYLMELLPDEYGIITPLGILMNGKIYYDPVIYIILIQSFIFLISPLYVTQLLVILVKRSRTVRSFAFLRYLCMATAFFLYSIVFSLGCLLSFVQFRPLPSFVELLFSVRTYIPLMVPVVAFHQIFAIS